jgi:hypothetical protein
MPFIPFPKEQREAWYRNHCTHPEHDPPQHMVIKKTCIWVCPACGRQVTIYPNQDIIKH